MNRTDIAWSVRSADTQVRAPAHLAKRRKLKLTPSLLASFAILGLESNALIGSLGILLFIVASATLILFQPLFNARQIMLCAPLLIIPFLAILSTVWSDAPQKTMREAIELFLTFAAAIVICRNIRPERLILILFAALLGMSLLLAPLIPAAIAAKAPLIAWMGSKNQVGSTGYQLFALAVGVLADRRQPAIARWMAFPAMPLALSLCYAAQSGGTTSSIVLFLLVFPPLAALGALKPAWRSAVVAIALGLMVVAGLYHAEIDAAVTDFRVTVLNKDATLTGRTYLWEVADRLSAARPTLGYGYAAFWRQGNIEAEGLWRWGGVPNRSGFNFHNVFVATRIDLGLIGESLLIISLVGVAAVALIRQISRPQLALACLIGLTLVNYVRSFVEEGLVSPFSLLTVIWLGTAVYAFPASIPGKQAGNDTDRQPPGTIARTLGPLRQSPGAERRSRRSYGRSV